MTLKWVEPWQKLGLLKPKVSKIINDTKQQLEIYSNTEELSLRYLLTLASTSIHIEVKNINYSQL